MATSLNPGLNLDSSDSNRGSDDTESEPEPESANISAKMQDPAKFRDPIYAYFSTAGENQFKCLECRKKVTKAGGQTNLKRHLKRHHAKRHTELEAQEKGGSTKKKPKSMREFLVRDDSTSSTGSAATPGPSSATGLSGLAIPHGCFGSQMYYGKDDSRYLLIRERIAQWICKDLQPFSVVDSEGFLHLMHAMDPRFLVPSRETVQRDCNLLYDVTRDSTKRLLAESCEKFAFTTDMWTSRTMDSYASLTVHFVGNDWQLHSKRLGIHHFSGTHDHLSVATWITSQLQNWNLDLNDVVVAVTDNGSNIVKAIQEDMGIERLPCAGHVINLAVQSCLGINGIHEAVRSCRRLCEHFHRSRPAKESLEALQKESGGPIYRVVSDCVTRWNSTYFMISRVVHLCPSIVRTAANSRDVSKLLPSNHEWKILKQLMVVLQPLADLTIYISGSSYVTGSALAASIALVKQQLQREDAEAASDIKKGKMEIVAKLDKYYSSTGTQDSLNVMAYLDPRFKTFGHDVTSKHDTEQKLLTEMVEIAVLGDTVRGQGVSENVTRGKGTGLKSLFAALGATPSPSKTTPAQVASKELSYYQAIAQADIDTDPLNWWKNHQNELPTMAILARKYLGTVATSVPSECLFSVAGDIVSEMRNRLNPDNVSMIGFLHDNLEKAHLPQYQRMWSVCYCAICKKLIEERGMVPSSD